MTTQDIIDHLDSKPYLDHRITQLAGDILSLQEEKERLEEIRRYVNQVTDVIDGIPIQIIKVRDSRLAARTVTPDHFNHRWGHCYENVNNSSIWGVCINGKALPGMGVTASTDNIYLGDRLVGFYNSKDEAQQVLLDWVVGAKAPKDGF